MIGIPGFVDDYLTSEMRRGKVKNPKWFRCPIHDSPELQSLIRFNPQGVEHGLATIGLWEQLQRWAMRHWMRAGRFVMKNGDAMTIQQIAYAVGLSGNEEFVEAAIESLKGVGWLADLEKVPEVEVMLGQGGSERCGQPTPKPPRKQQVVPEVDEWDEGKYSSSARYGHASQSRVIVKALRENPECPRAVENPRKLETALCDAAVEGRDLEEIARAMSIYYSLDVGQDQYRIRPETFVRNRKEEEDWNSWFTDDEAQTRRAQLLRVVRDKAGLSEPQYLAMMTKHRSTPPVDLIRRVQQWESEDDDDGSAGDDGSGLVGDDGGDQSDGLG